jgi:hypothetical protein
MPVEANLKLGKCGHCDWTTLRRHCISMGRKPHVIGLMHPELEAPGGELLAWLPIVYIRVVTGHAALHGEFLGITPGQ